MIESMEEGTVRAINRCNGWTRSLGCWECKKKLHGCIDELGLQLDVRQPVAMTWPLTHSNSGAVNQAAARGPYNTTLLLTIVDRKCVKMFWIGEVVVISISHLY